MIQLYEYMSWQFSARGSVQSSDLSIVSAAGDFLGSSVLERTETAAAN